MTKHDLLRQDGRVVSSFVIRHSTFVICSSYCPSQMTLLINILLGIYVFVSLLMMLVILMQRPKSEGLGAAFGGGVTENIFGAQTTNVLTKVTGWLAAIFFLLTFFLSILYARKANRPSNLSRDVIAGSTPVPAASATPGATATANPGPSSAVGPPGTVTNMTPATTGPVSSVRPSDAAVGAVPPATTTSPAATSPAPTAGASLAPATSPATSANASAAPSASVSPKR
jgi:preprotein translocase subunit SecG